MRFGRFNCAAIVNYFVGGLCKIMYVAYRGVREYELAGVGGPKSKG